MNIRSWFHPFKGGEKEVLDLLTHHAILSLQASQLVQKVLSALAAGDHATAYVTYLDIDKAETEADHVHRELVEKLSNGVFFANLGTDLMNLAENIDGVADSAKNAGKILTQRHLSPTELSPILEKATEQVAVGVKAVSSLLLAVQCLGKSREELLRYAREVEEYEEVADIIKDSVIEHIYNLDVSVLSVVQLRDFVNMVDNISDYAEDAADVLYILVSKGYG